MKPWITSKTVWVGLITIVISLFQYVGTQDWSDWRAVNWPAFVAGALMIVLRWITDKPITSPVKAMDRLRYGKTKRS